MRIRGIHYDIGTTTLQGSSTRLSLSAAEIERDIADIRDGLGANAVRITGGDVGRMADAAETAARHGLEVWLSPMAPNADQPDTLGHILEAAELGERLRDEGVSTVVVLGCELSVFMAGILPGATHADRMSLLSDPVRLMAEVAAKGLDPQAQFAVFIRQAAELVRAAFQGPVTYAAGMWEDVDWSLFDFVGVDAYRDASNRQDYPDRLKSLTRNGIPVVITEVGCATYRGAAEAGGLGWTVVDRSTDKPALREGVERDELEQAAELSDIVHLAQESGVEGVFIYTYIMPSYPADVDPGLDLDAASYALVRSWPDGRIEPKAAYRAVADAYGVEPTAA